MASANARKDVRVQLRTGVRIRARGREAAATILDASGRGLLLSTDFPPPRSEIVEVTIGRTVVTGQVRWIDGKQFGVGLGDRIDVNVLTGRASGPLVIAPRLPEASPEPERGLTDHIWLALGVVSILIALGILIKLFF